MVVPQRTDTDDGVGVGVNESQLLGEGEPFLYLGYSSNCHFTILKRDKKFRGKSKQRERVRTDVNFLLGGPPVTNWTYFWGSYEERYG